MKNSETGASVLFVCRANLCRSPMAGAFLSRRVAEWGVQASVETAGVAPAGPIAPPGVVRAMSAVGIDMSGHRSKALEHWMLRDSDIVITMTKQQLLHVAAKWPDCWTHAFTFGELLRLGEVAGARRSSETATMWTARLGAERTRSTVLGLTPGEDVTDPMGGRQRQFDRSRTEMDLLVGRLADLLWPSQRVSIGEAQVGAPGSGRSHC